MLPALALFVLISLWLVSCSVREVPFDMAAGSREGCLSPLGRTFSSCDGGRSISSVSEQMLVQTSLSPEGFP